MVKKPDSGGATDKTTEDDATETSTASAETSNQDAQADAADVTSPDEDAGSVAETDTKEELATALAGSTLVAAEVAEDDAEPEPEPAGEDVAHEDHEEHAHHEEPQHWSMAARALATLLILIAGAGLALWGAPKVANVLPSGLAPVKSWLLPGERQSQSEIAALREDLSAQIASIDTALDEARVSEIASEAAATSQASLAEQMTALSDQVAAADSADIEARLAAIETKVEGLAAQVESLNSFDFEGLTTEQSQALSGFSAAVEGLRGEISELASQQGAFSQRIDEVEVSVERKLEEAEAEVAAVQEEASKEQSATIVRAALSTIESALAAGDPYETALAELGSEIATDIPVALGATAATGVTPFGALRSAFGDAAHAAIRADIQSQDGEGVAGRLTAFLESQIATRSLTPQEGDSTDAVLSRAEDALRRDNLASAVDELATLPDPVREAMASWISKATARVEAMSAFTELKAGLTAQN